MPPKSRHSVLATITVSTRLGGHFVRYSVREAIHRAHYCACVVGPIKARVVAHVVSQWKIRGRATEGSSALQDLMVCPVERMH